MDINPHLHEAVAIFKELGWDKAELSEAPTLPLGTPEQQKIALKGLRTGDWGDHQLIVRDGMEVFTWVPVVEVDPKMLALFTTRLGVNAQRAREVLIRCSLENYLPIIQQRGKDFAQEFVSGEFSTDRSERSRTSTDAVELNLRMGLEPPTIASFYRSWAWCLEMELFKLYENWGWKRCCPIEVLKPSFFEYFPKALDVGYPKMITLIARLEKIGWIDRATALDSMIRCVTVGVSRDEVKVIFDDLKVTDEELLSYFDQLCGQIATGQALMIEQFGLRLIPIVNDSQLADIALPSLYASTKKATLAVLNALKTRPTPSPETQEILVPRLSELTNSTDTTTAKRTAALLKHWGREAVEIPTDSPTYTWEDTPKLWELPRFERGVASVDTLSRAGQTLASQNRTVHYRVADVEVELFFALANELARTDIAAAQRALKGTTGIMGGVFAAWAKTPGKKRYKLNTDTDEIFAARLNQLVPKLGTLPCLLSEPSFVDLSITADDLVERLKKYEDAGAAALEADLQLALARLNPNTVTPDTSAQLGQLNVALELENGTLFARTATRVARDYLADPVKEPWQRRFMRKVQIKAYALPKSLAGLPKRLQLSNSDSTAYHCVFPHFGNPAFQEIRWWTKVDCEDAPALAQAARHGTPLPPGAAINFFAMQRPMKNGGPEFSAALSDAWRRGLIRPGEADIIFLDWEGEITHLKALALALDDAAHTGMLSVVWPILDALIGASLKEKELLTGTSDVALVMETLAPSIAAAIAAGRAPQEAAHVPHLRALAARTAKNKAVTAAKNAVGVLPDYAENSATPETPVEGLMSP